LNIFFLLSLIVLSQCTQKKRTAFPKEHDPLISRTRPMFQGRTARTGTPSGIQRHHQDHFSNLLIFFCSLHKKTDHTFSGMIRICLFCCSSVLRYKHRNAKADRYSQLCQRQVMAVFSMLRITEPSFRVVFFNLAVRKKKFKFFFQKNAIF